MVLTHAYIHTRTYIHTLVCRSEDTKDLREEMQEEANKVSRKAHQCKAMLKELEDMGLLTRRPHPSDKRSQLLTLSADGQALMATVEKAEHAVEAQMLKGLSQDEVASFLKLAEKMLNNLQGN